MISLNVSFLFSRDELYTLVKKYDLSDAGKAFMDKVLLDAREDDLSGFVQKQLAKAQDGKILLEPVICMIAESIASAIEFWEKDGCYEIKSEWVALKCCLDTKIPDGLKIMPYEI